MVNQYFSLWPTMAIETWNPGRWGTSDFKWQGWLNGGTNPKKSLEQNLTPEIPCWITEQQKFPESIHWYNMKNINIRFEYPQKSVLKSSYPKKYLPKFSYPKSKISNPQKFFDHLSVTWIPEFPWHISLWKWYKWGSNSIITQMVLSDETFAVIGKRLATDITHSWEITKNS